MELYAKTSTFVAGLVIAGTVAMISLLGVSNTGCDLSSIIGPTTNTPPIITNTPVPPGPVTNPVPVTALYKGTMFFPHQLCGTTKTPPWPGNSGVDSLLGFVDIHGNSWEKDARRNGYAWIKAMGGDSVVYISEKLYGNAELQMFLTNRKHPTDGHRMNDGENEVVIARKTYGVNRWIVSLFNDDSTSLRFLNVQKDGLRAFNDTAKIRSADHEPYIQQITGCYDWADVNQVAWMICLETNERFNPTETIQRVEWVKKYSPGHRIIVGSANADFLKQVANAAKAKGLVVELWAETPFHPFQLSMSNADAFLNVLKGLLSYGSTWAGEYGNAKDASVAYVSKKAIEMGCAGIGSYSK